MEALVEFIKMNYLVFTIITIFLILSLIGYCVDKNRNKDIKLKLEIPEDKKEESISSQSETIQDATVENLLD